MTAADEGMSMNDCKPTTRNMEMNLPKQRISVDILSPKEGENLHIIHVPFSNSSSPLSSAPSNPVLPRTPPRIKQDSGSDDERSRHLARRVAVERAKSVPGRTTRKTSSCHGLLSPLTPRTRRDCTSNFQDPPQSCGPSSAIQSTSVVPTKRARRSTEGSSLAPMPYSPSDQGPPYATPNNTVHGESDYGLSQNLSHPTMSTPTAGTKRSSRYSYSSGSSPLSSAPSSPVFPSSPNHKTETENKPDSTKVEVQSPKKTKSHAKSDKAKRPTISPYFPKSPQKRLKTGPISCIPFPPLASPAFGLVQESLQHDPFRLLIAVIFLNKTRGAVAMPVYHALMTRYPTPEALAAAKLEDVVGFFQHLGLQNQRAKKCIALANAWLTDPPKKGKRYRRLHYPSRNDGKDISVGHGPVFDEDARVAWEVGNLPAIGAYAIDSWRIFCRDRLRGLPAGLPAMTEMSQQQREEEMSGEWARVLPGDKELRAYLRWRWLRVGWVWDPVSGERKAADSDTIARIEKGGVVVEGSSGAEVLGEEAGGVVKREQGLDANHGDGDALDCEDEEEEWMFTPESWRLRTGI